MSTILMFAAAIGVGAAYAQQPAQKKAVARLTGIEGTVLLSQPDGMAAAGKEVRIPAGTRVVTTAGAKATIAHDGGCDVRLDENMRFTVRDGGACAAMIAGVESLAPPAVASGGAGTPAGARGAVALSPIAAAALISPAVAYGIYVAKRDDSNVSPN